MDKYKIMIEKLKNGEIDSIEITKDEFMEFREVLVNDEKFKHFRGEAKQGGRVVYRYMDEPRA
ncbi:hypothetical protein NST62_02995 [Ureibacillus sp. FSL K6-8385]|uniref:Abortive phage infection protein n=1 Tax=Ureibacillus terrenus TaxID=118246 RepID=A0A540UYX1_9BACL|nr:hypothetical protein [Ureibacillus terrenus]MED3661925.1 hypothetical protein [Ureibacillus terrenus]MED3765115.1 hypothetical protein [Ureibacillus terrenus]TQE89710.1 hypothetical protein FKZ59_11805 [Ureibacillus terrenus]